MAYSSSENAARASAPGQAMVLVTKSDTDQVKHLRALRVYVPSGNDGATLKVTPSFGADGVTPGADADAITLTFPPGVYWEPSHFRRVWVTGSTAAVIVHGIPSGS